MVASLQSSKANETAEMHFGIGEEKVTMHINVFWYSSKLLFAVSKTNIDLYKKFTLHSSRL